MFYSVVSSFLFFEYIPTYSIGRAREQSNSELKRRRVCLLFHSASFATATPNSIVMQSRRSPANCNTTCSVVHLQTAREKELPEPRVGFYTFCFKLCLMYIVPQTEEGGRERERRREKEKRHSGMSERKSLSEKQSAARAPGLLQPADYSIRLSPILPLVWQIISPAIKNFETKEKLIKIN